MTMAGKQKHSPFGEELIAGMEEAAVYARCNPPNINGHWEASGS